MYVLLAYVPAQLRELNQDLTGGVSVCLAIERILKLQGYMTLEFLRAPGGAPSMPNIRRTDDIPPLTVR